MSEALFCIENLRVAYPHRSDEKTQWAVDDVSFILQPGERMGLVGESGCGKSTLGRAAMRLLPASSQIEGRVTFQGRSVFEMTPEQLRQFRGEAVALIFQDPMTRLDPLMTIGNHCLETLKAHSPQLSSKQAKEKAIATLEKVKIPASRWSQYPHEFSGGMRQRVAIALALLLSPKLIVADEPTTSLDVTVSAQILQELTRLCGEENMALLLISHDLALVAEYCDRIGVMYNGKMVETGSSQTVFQNPQHEYTQSLLKAALHIQTVDENEVWEEGAGSREQGTRFSSSQAQSPILRVLELQQHYTLEPNFVERLLKRQNQTIKAVDGINLELYPGEILGLVGESGCGKSTLSRTILQLIRPTAGKVEFLGQDLTNLSRQQVRASRRQMQMVFQDPHACLNPAMTVGQSIADPLLIHKLADAANAKQQVLSMLEKVGLKPPGVYYERYPSDLSGGQQQRVAIARALITRPKLLICDEPVSMLDASVQSQVLDLMLELKEEFELTYLFITHDLWLARFLCDRIAVMNSGKIVEIGPTKQIFANPQHPYTKTLLAAAPLLGRA
ncbi:MAG: dipeptide ABC transporter ATP-binding protein [Brasilonema octagenarum HA4186-MV1]|jgi:peptide/nickel transport system ATP-binding protein|uniref:ABC transporter ATP-binding protein n=1 Tax=Brasilonema octagenarum UFV-OR1 TaxID=417115 RepID=A0ABX1M7C8_9CYAN|nr:ABC transporter ATP-binding protein [Brasilonema octagenarum]MBW4627022.1 dipeptide ABC transporter ATP-binding protein [Brasilonema octagenarum HA4186-MV1]NMF63011.1 ABC transporter ATP-binding protein [Brasilonema octagenarum UFV-OR1]